MRIELMRLGTGAVAAALISALVAFAPASAQANDQSVDAEAEGIVAAQIRSQGYQCDDPHAAEPDTSDTTPGEEAWILSCGNATYRVKLVPDQAAMVERID